MAHIFTFPAPQFRYLLTAAFSLALLAGAWAQAGSLEFELEMRDGKKFKATRVTLDGQHARIVTQGAEISRPLQDLRKVELAPQAPGDDPKSLRMENARFQETLKSMKTELDTTKSELAKYRKAVEQSVQSEPDKAKISRALETLTAENEALKKELTLKNTVAKPNTNWLEEKRQLEKNLKEAIAAKEIALKEAEVALKNASQQSPVFRKNTCLVKDPPNRRPLRVRNEELTRVDGMVVNEGKEPVRRVILEVTAFDSKDKALDTTYTYVMELQPGQPRPFIADLDIPSANVARITAVPLDGK